MRTRSGQQLRTDDGIDEDELAVGVELQRRGVVRGWRRVAAAAVVVHGGSRFPDRGRGR